MLLEGVVTNVTNFGAFVDIGVHQDGLVHISALANRFVKDPHDVVKAGDVVKVKVLEVDAARKRIALTMRLGDEALPAPAGEWTASSESAPHRRSPRRRDGESQRGRRQTAGSRQADAFGRHGSRLRQAQALTPRPPSGQMRKALRLDSLTA
jgi:uncharacterized protein